MPCPRPERDRAFLNSVPGGTSVPLVLRLACMSVLGFTASIGFAMSGMANPDHIRNFFNLKPLLAPSPSAAEWDPALLYTFVAALGLHFLLYNGLISKVLRRPLFGDIFSIPTAGIVDFKLLLGAVVFGVGWAIGGFCPGPAITAAFAGNQAALLFIVAVFVGYLLAYPVNKPQSKESNVSEAIASVILLAFVCFAAFQDSTPNFSLQSDPALGYSVAAPLAGGIIIGLSAFAMMAGLGRVFGISGLTSGMIYPSTVRRDRLERWFFFIGIILGGMFTRSYLPRTVIPHYPTPIPLALVGGVLVGIGTNLENGCTSGHGICGISRLSIRSFVATGVFFVTNLTVSTLFF